MNDKTTKKGLLATGLAVLTTAVPLIVNGRPLEGGILTAFGIALVVAYDYLDDRLKEPPQLPDGVDEELFHEAAMYLADKVEKRNLAASLSDLSPEDKSSDGSDEA